MALVLEVILACFVAIIQLTKNPEIKVTGNCLAIDFC
jgi:hypothetical protein